MLPVKSLNCLPSRDSLKGPNPQVLKNNSGLLHLGSWFCSVLYPFYLNDDIVHISYLLSSATMATLPKIIPPGHETQTVRQQKPNGFGRENKGER